MLYCVSLCELYGRSYVCTVTWGKYIREPGFEAVRFKFNSITQCTAITEFLKIRTPRRSALDNER
jgi:hypothetical protein